MEEGVNAVLAAMITSSAPSAHEAMPTNQNLKPQTAPSEPVNLANKNDAVEEETLHSWFPATCPGFEARCGDVKRLVKEDLEDPHRRKHLESFRKCMQEWETYDPGAKNEMQDETASALLADLLKMKPKTSGEFDAAMQSLRKKYKVAPAKSQLVTAYNRFIAEEANCEQSQGDASLGLCSQEEKEIGSPANRLRDPMLESLMRRKAVRTNSGVIVITVLTAPGRFSCPQDCHYCPNEPGQPRSYLSTEPAVLRANQNGWSPLKQFKDRAETLRRNGHVVDKIEVLVLGGTWSGYPQDYQEEFIRDVYYAANVFGAPEPVRQPLSLEEEQSLNETADCRIVGLTLYINRGCTRRDAIKAIRMLKDAGFKVDVHLMPDLPSSNPDLDRQMFHYALCSPDLQADQWKIYPCEVTPFSTIEQWYKEGKFVPYADTDGDTLLSLICSVKAAVHPWIRLNRVVRDIPNQSIIGGNSITNLRQELSRELQHRHLRCRCIRCREVKDAQFDLGIAELCIRRYETNGGVEYFVSFETPDRKTIFGFLRLRLRARRSSRDCPFSVLNGAALLRELHVYGCLVPHGEAKSSGDLRPQHAGFGRRLIQAAEILALANGYHRMAVIAGIGSREYYRMSGYQVDDTYMIKDLTVSGLHAGREDLLADRPKQLLIEWQDMQQAAATLLLPLPPREAIRKVKGRQMERKKFRASRKPAVQPEVSSTAVATTYQETKERATAFQTEYTTTVEVIDVTLLLQSLQNSEPVQSGSIETPAVFADRDTFAEHCDIFAALQQAAKPSTRSNSSSPLSPFSAALLSIRQEATVAIKTRLFFVATVTGAVAAGLLWFVARRH